MVLLVLLMSICEAMNNILLSISNSGFNGGNNSNSDDGNNGSDDNMDIKFQLNFIDSMFKFIVSVCRFLVVLDIQSQGSTSSGGGDSDKETNISYFHSCPDDFLQLVTKLGQLLVYCGYYCDIETHSPGICTTAAMGAAVVDTTATTNSAYSNILLLCIKYILACPTLGKNLLQKTGFKPSPVVAMVTKLNNNSSSILKGQYDVTRWCVDRVSHWGRATTTITKEHANNTLDSMQQRGYMLLLILLSPSNANTITGEWQ